MFEERFKGIIRQAQEFPDKEGWQRAQGQALEALQAIPSDREQADIIRVEYPEGSVGADRPPIFDRPDPAKRPIILNNEFFSPASEKIRTPRLQPWDGTHSVPDTLALLVKKGIHAVSFRELATDPFRTVLRNEQELRQLVLTGVVLRYQNRDWYAVLDYAAGEAEIARVAHSAQDQGRFVRFCTEERLQAAAKNLPKGHVLLLV